MLKNKFFTIGIGAIVVLAIIYLGNKVMTSTPLGEAGGAFQYKVMSTSECLGKVGDMYFDCFEQKFNEKGKDGWELVLWGGDSVVFKKK